MRIQPEPTPAGVSVQTKRRPSSASLFIIESLKFKDESEGRLEGDILTQILRLSGKDTRYRYIRTRQELETMVGQFTKSRRRYLHISCHGNDQSLSTTLDPLPFPEFGDILRPHLRNRRLFISACGAVNADLATALMRKNGCLSIVGPANDICFDEAAVMWASFYHLMFKEDPDAMAPSSMKLALSRLQETFSRCSDASPPRGPWRRGSERLGSRLA